MILVVGGTGFIGKHLLLSLAGDGEPAVTVSRRPDDAFLAAHAPACRSMSLDALYAEPALLRDCRAVVYLAGSDGGPSKNKSEPWKEMSETVEPALRLMSEIVTQNSRAHFVYFSSGGTVYGNADRPLISEETPLKPISAYGLGKAVAERTISLMAEQGLRATILRPSNPVGVWQQGRGQGVVAALLNAAEAGTPFTVIGDGTMVRDYLDVRDLVRAVRLVIDRPERSIGETYNVGSGRPVSVNDIVAIVAEISGRRLDLTHVPERGVDVERVVLDSARIREHLGWEPAIPLEQTIRDVVAARFG